MMALTQKENLMAMASINGIMEKFMRENGSMDLRMVPAFGEAQRETPTLGNGKMEKLTVMEFIPGLMATDMKVNSRNALNMDKGSKNLPMGISIEVFIKMESLTVMDNTFGVMEALIKVILKRDSEMVKVFGESQVIPTQILMKAHLSMRKRKVMVCLPGPTKANIWVIS